MLPFFCHKGEIMRGGKDKNSKGMLTGTGSCHTHRGFVAGALKM